MVWKKQVRKHLQTNVNDWKIPFIEKIVFLHYKMCHLLIGTHRSTILVDDKS